MDRTALVVADGKDGLADHGPQVPLGNVEAVSVVHGGQVGEVLIAAAHNVVGGGAPLNVDGKALGGDGYHVVGHTAEDLPKQPCGQHDGSAIRHLCGHLGNNAGFQVVAAEAQSVHIRLDEHTFQGLNGAFGCHYSARGGNGGL